MNIEDINPESLGITPQAMNYWLSEAERIASRIPSMKLLETSKFLIATYLQFKSMKNIDGFEMCAEAYACIFKYAGIDINQYIKD